MKRGREFWTAHVTAWRGSGLSLAAYSRGHGLAKGTLGCWSSKLKGEVRVGQELVELPPGGESEMGRRPIELVVEGRYLLRLWPGTREADIREVVTALEPRR